MRLLRPRSPSRDDNSEKVMRRIILDAGRLSSSHGGAGCIRCRRRHGRRRYGDHFQVALDFMKVSLRFHCRMKKERHTYIKYNLINHLSNSDRPSILSLTVLSIKSQSKERKKKKRLRKLLDRRTDSSMVFCAVRIIQLAKCRSSSQFD